MANVVSATITVSAAVNDADTSKALSPVAINLVYPVAGPLKQTFPAGSGTGAINKLYFAQVTVPAGSTAVLTLSDASLIGPLGETVTFTKVTSIMCVNNGAAVVTLGGGTHPLGGFTGAVGNTINLQPGCPYLNGKNDAAGVAVASGTADALTFTNASGSDCLVDVLIVGR